MNDAPPLNVYGMLMLAGILLTAWVWGRITKKESQHDSRLTWVYFFGLFGALLGAKLAFLLAEGWFYRDNWIALLSGRSITGGLLGGYLAVEIGKKYLKYPHTTGDVFAIVTPIGLILGRIGCVFAGCCPGSVCEARWWTLIDGQGIARWPAAPVELLFNAVFLVWAIAASRCDWQKGNRFHIYLIAYGLFRFGHEFLRDGPRISGALGGYHIIALFMIAFGVLRYVQRRQQVNMEGANMTVTNTAST